MWLPRTAIPPSAPLTWETPAGDTDVPTRILQDLQKFLACARVGIQSSCMFTNDDKQMLKLLVASNCFSARANLVFKSNLHLRRNLWCPVCRANKEAKSFQ